MIRCIVKRIKLYLEERQIDKLRRRYISAQVAYMMQGVFDE